MKGKIILLLILSFLSATYEAITEIEYRKNLGFLGRAIDQFMFRVNRNTDVIYAEYVKYNSNGMLSDVLRKYKIPFEKLGVLPLDELFHQLNEIQFPEETDCADHNLYDVPYWNLSVDGKTYRGNVGTDFLDQFNELISITDVKEYCISHYNDGQIIKPTIIDVEKKEGIDKIDNLNKFLS